MRQSGTVFKLNAFFGRDHPSRLVMAGQQPVEDGRKRPYVPAIPIVWHCAIPHPTLPRKRGRVGAGTSPAIDAMSFCPSYKIDPRAGGLEPTCPARDLNRGWRWRHVGGGSLSGLRPLL